LPCWTLGPPITAKRCREYNDRAAFAVKRR
jgi:hypothetical protein